MPAARFTRETRDALIDLFAEGLSIAEAAAVVNVRPRTIKHWITRGRREGEGAYAEFVAAVDEARQRATDRERPLSDDELALVVSRAARKGSVAAMKLRWEMIRAERARGEADNAGAADPDDPFDAIDREDELAARRRERGR